MKSSSAICTIINMSLYVLLFFILINLRDYKCNLLRGKRAQDGQFPWLIQFQTVAPCGGVLLSSDWVLTAAQCVQDKRNSIILFATGLSGPNSKQAIPVKATYIYPTYEPYSVLPDRDKNIALLKLTTPFNIYHNRIALPNVLPVKYGNNLKLCQIFGWQSYVAPWSKVLAKPIQYYEVILNSWKMCTYMLRTNVNYTNLFCTMAELNDEIKACAGNPGSPVVCLDQNNETSLVGIASWTNFSLDCGDLPTYLDLDTFRAWLNELVFNNKAKKELEYRFNEKNCALNTNTSVHNTSLNTSACLQVAPQISYSSENTNLQLDNVTQTIIEHEETSPQSAIKTHFVNNVYHSTSNNINDTKASLDSYYDMSNMNIMKEPTNSIYKYKEIGIPQNRNKSVGSLNKQDATSELGLCHNKSNNKNRDKTMPEDYKNEIEADDLELLLSFNLEDITTSHSSGIVYTKSLYVCICFVFWNFCVIYT